MDDFFHCHMIGNPSVIVLEMMDGIFPSPRINSQMEKKHCDGVSLFYVGYPGTLLLSSTFNNGEASQGIVLSDVLYVGLDPVLLLSVYLIPYKRIMVDDDEFGCG
jgi:hypothetical protein